MDSHTSLFSQAGNSLVSRLCRPALFLILGAAVAPLPAQPVLQGVIEEVMRFSVFGGAPRTVGSPRAELNTTYDTGPYLDNGVEQQGRLDIDAWAEASVIAGTPTFRAFLQWDGSMPPIGDRPSGAFGARVFGTYRDSWTVNIPGVAAGTSVFLRPGFHTHGTFYTFSPGTGPVLLTENFFPLFSGTPSAPEPSVGVFTYFNLGYDADSLPMPGGNVTLAPSWQPLGFEVFTGTPFNVYFEGGGGYVVSMRDIAATFSDPNDMWGTRGTYDASATVQLSALELFDANGQALTTFDVFDSGGSLVVPAPVAAVPSDPSAVPEPSTWGVFAGAFLVAGALLRRRRTCR